jgi:hypothetical protein
MQQFSESIACLSFWFGAHASHSKHFQDASDDGGQFIGSFSG